MGMSYPPFCLSNSLIPVTVDLDLHLFCLTCYLQEVVLVPETDSLDSMTRLGLITHCYLPLAHSTICQPDDSHTFGRTFGGRPARPTRATMAAKIQIAAATCRTKAISRAGVGELRHETNQVLPTSW